MLEEYFHILTDPAHALAEITFTLIFDVLIIGLLWGVVFLKVILPRVLRRHHADIDAEHGYVDHVKVQDSL